MYLLRCVGMMRFIRLGLRRRIVKLFVPITSGRQFSFSVPYHGMTYSGNISIAQEWHVFFFGGYELAEAAMMNDLLCLLKHPVAFDIGANLGAHSYVMRNHAREVHSFEPYGPLADSVAKHINDNGITNIKLHRFGLGDRTETAKYFFDTASNNSGTGSFRSDHSGATAVSELEIRRGDDCDLPNPDFVKIDVEGYEAPALAGLTKTLSQAKPIIMMEVTQSSWDLFVEYGGLNKVLNYQFSMFEICRPKTVFWFFQTGAYRLLPINMIEPRNASYNVLIVPNERLDILRQLV